MIIVESKRKKAATILKMYPDAIFVYVHVARNFVS